MKKTILICPHIDDEFLFAVSLLLSVIGDIFVIYTSEGDFISEDSFNKNNKAMEIFSEYISKFRKRIS